MKYLDFIGQTLLLISGMVMAILGFAESDWSLSLILPQLLMGLWQMLSSAISIIVRSPYRELKSIHFGVALVYLATLYFGPGMKNQVYLVIPAWTIALYYYGITWRWVFHKPTSGGNFLSHINF